MDITPLLKLMVDQSASDLFFTADAAPSIKLSGVISPLHLSPLSSHEIDEIVNDITNDDQKKEFETNLELNMALTLKGIGRFRVNIFKQRGTKAIVIRYIKSIIPSIQELKLPDVLKSVVMQVRGLVLLVGSTGSGKSTTLASMIDYRNTNQAGHILTIEDPIEFVHSHKKSIVAQREIGIDTLNYENALTNAMREAPDVILIGEIRDRRVMKHALAYAETGHLCISTLHANNANQALDRIINFFPEDAKQHILMDLSLNLRAIVSIRLIPSIAEGRVPVVEVMLNTPYVAELIKKGKIDDIKEVMSKNSEHGMQTFDQSLVALYNQNIITKENAIKYADSTNNVSLEIRLNEDSDYSEIDNITIQPERD